MNADDICDEEYIQAQRLYCAMNAPLDEREEPMPSPEQAMHGTRSLVVALIWFGASACFAAVVLAVWLGMKP